MLTSIINNNRLQRIWFLAKTDFKKRYYDSFLGLFWALLNPLMRCAVYFFAFSFIRNERFENFVVYIFGGIIVWSFFSEATNKSMNILSSKRYLIENITFNWADILYANIISVMFGFAFNFMAYIGLMLASGLIPPITLLLAPIFFLNLALMVLSFSFLVSSISVFIKDIKHLWTIVILAGFWSAPIFIFTIEQIMEAAPILAFIHPITAILVNFRNITMFDLPIDVTFFIWGWVYAIIMFIISYYIFKKASVLAIERL